MVLLRTAANKSEISTQYSVLSNSRRSAQQRSHSVPLNASDEWRGACLGHDRDHLQDATSKHPVAFQTHLGKSFQRGLGIDPLGENLPGVLSGDNRDGLRRGIRVCDLLPLVTAPTCKPT